MAVKGGRQAFVKSSIALLSDLGFDGLDLDWEGPTTDSEAKLFVAILEDLRTAMDDYALDNNLDYKFILTAAVQANPKKPLVPHFTAAANYLDYWGLSTSPYLSPRARSLAALESIENIANFPASHSGLRLCR